MAPKTATPSPTTMTPSTPTPEVERIYKYMSLLEAFECYGRNLHVLTLVLEDAIPVMFEDPVGATGIVIYRMQVGVRDYAVSNKTTL